MLSFVTWILGIIAIVSLYVRAVEALNGRSKALHGCEAITTKRAAIATGAWLLLVFSLIFGQYGLVIGGLGAAAIFLWLANAVYRETSPSIAVTALVLLVIAGAGIALIALLLVVMFSGGANKEEKPRSD